eukprot:UN11221
MHTEASKQTNLGAKRLEGTSVMESNHTEAARPKLYLFLVVAAKPLITYALFYDVIYRRNFMMQNLKPSSNPLLFHFS